MLGGVPSIAHSARCALANAARLASANSHRATGLPPLAAASSLPMHALTMVLSASFSSADDLAGCESGYA